MRGIDNKKLIAIIILITMSFFITDWILGFLYESSHEKPLNLKNNTEVLITENDGDIREDGVLKEKGEIANIYLKLPASKRSEAYCIEMSVYHCVIEAYYDNTLIYDEGKEYAANGKMIGAIYPCIEIPDEAWGDTINIRLISQENVPLNVDKNIMLYRLEDNRQYFSSNFFLGFYHYIVILFISFIVFILMLINYRRNNIVKQVMWLSVFCFILASWGLTYFGYHNILFRNSWIFAQAEYMSVYYVPIPLGIYALYKEPDDSFMKKIFTVITIVLIGFSSVATILNFNTEIHFVDLLPIMQLLIIVSAIPFVYQISKNAQKSNLHTRVFLYGFLLLIILSIGDILRLNLVKWGFIEQDSILSFTSIGIIGFITTTIIFSLMMLFDYLEFDIERKTLLSMAYDDPMTNLANRAGCDKRLTWLEISGANDYSLIYMDLNNLKYVNDKYGHIFGDEYIKHFAIILKQVFNEDIFCGRLGGDEFLVVLRGERAIITEEYIKSFQNEIDKLNESDKYEFEISVAVGYAKKSEYPGSGVMYLLNKADEMMYLHKEDSRKE